MSSVYNAQCRTWQVAQEIAKDFRDVSSLDELFQPPFCLRLVQEFRDEKTTQFRRQVANEMRKRRHGT